MADLSKNVELLTALMQNQQAQLSQIAAIAQSLAANAAATAAPPESPTAASGGPAKQTRGPTIVDLAGILDSFVYDPLSGNTFEAWYARYASVFKGQAEHLGESGRIQLLLMKLETKSNKVYRDTIFPKTEEDFTFDETVKALKGLFDTEESLFRKRYNALQVRREPGEEVSKFASRVNRFAEEFVVTSFGAEQLKCLLFVLGFDGVVDKEVRTRLLNLMETKEAVTLKEMVAEADRLNKIKADTKLGSSTPSPSVQKVDHSGKQHGHQQGNQRSNQRGRRQHPGKQPPSASGSGKQQHSGAVSKQPRSPCWGCGRMHMYAECEYRTKTCPDCNRSGHKTGYCAAFKYAGGNPGSGKVNVVNSSPDVKVIVNRKFLDVTVNGIKTRFQYDSAADISIITEATWRSLGSPALVESDCRPMDAQCNALPIKGELPVSLSFNGMQRTGRCFVSSTPTNLFGIEWIELFGLWEKAPATFCKAIKDDNITEERKRQVLDEIKTSFALVFSESMGKCDIKATLHLKPGARDVFRKKRPVPFHSVVAVGDELDRLQAAGIITPIERSSFAAPIVVVQKANGTIRICGDYSTGLNDSLQLHEYPIPTPEDIFASMFNCRWFSKVDLSDAYLQIEVDPASGKLLTITTIKGLYSFNRLCPGVRPAAAIFQQTMEMILAGIEYVIIYFDDILIAAPTIEAHNAALKEVFKRLAEHNMRVRLEKCNFFQTQVKYLGIIVDRDGQRPDPAKTAAIATMPAPANAPQLRSYLGALTFYSRFIKSMATIRAPLNQLLKQGVDYIWNEECESAFVRFKEIILSDLLLTHYDPRLPIVVAADASQTGIGGIAYHTYADGAMKAFLHVSRRLTPAETRYSQIELEALAIVWSVSKFHKYIFGRRFQLYTDHRPLLSIFGSKKGIPTHVANRIQRWAITLMAYDFELHYTRTDEFGHADVLSRLIADQRSGAEDELVIAEVRISSLFVDQVNASFPVSFQEIVRATEDE